MVKSRIVTILGVDYKKIRFIPNQEHPCDHFVVTANIVAHEWMILCRVLILLMGFTYCKYIIYIWGEDIDGWKIVIDINCMNKSGVELLFFGSDVLLLLVGQCDSFASCKLEHFFNFIL